MSVSSSSTDPGAEAGQGSQWLSSSTGVRVLQACHSCRRRKTKCSGRRPTCSACILRRLPCTWPSLPEAGVAYTPAPAPTPDALAYVPADNGAAVTVGQEVRPKRRRLSLSAAGGNQPPVSLLRRALDIFRERHFSVEFCSFLHLPSVDAGMLCQRAPFFAHAIIALSALYMTPQEATDQGFSCPEALSEWHTVAAREYSRQTVDTPSICSIQANLILALRELLARTLYKAWIFAGTAIRQAQALRLGRENHGRLPNRLREIQRRIFWAAFVMDRMVSHCCWRPQMIDADVVTVNLPCPEMPFLLDESFNAPSLETLEFPSAVSHIGLPAYFISILHIWAQAAYTQLKGVRHARPGPDDAESFFNRHEKKVDAIHRSLTGPMQWSEHNWRLFRHMNQSSLFVNIHLLLSHARCVMHQEYLPYRDSADLASRLASPHSSGLEGAACSPPRENEIISRCLSSSEAILDIVSSLSRTNEDGGRQDLQSIFTAGAMLSAVNIQLWAYYHHFPGKDEEKRKSAQARVEEVAAVFQLWKAQWPVADAWISTLESLRRLYQVTYAPNLGLREALHDGQPAESSTTAPPPALNESDAFERPYPRLTEGNGLPDLEEKLSEKIRFVLLASLEDTDARKRMLSSSISTQLENSRDCDELIDDLGFDFYSFYTDETWPGLDMISHAHVEAPGPAVAQGETQRQGHSDSGDQGVGILRSRDMCYSPAL